MAAKIEKRGDNKYRLNVFAGYDPSGKQIIHRKTITAPNITEAKNEYKLFAADVARGLVTLGGKMTLKEFYQYWTLNYAAHRHEERTLARNAELFERIDKHLGAKQIGKIEPKHILEFYKALAMPGEKKPSGKKKKRPEKNEEAAKAASEPEKAEQTPKEPLSLSGSTIQKHHKLLSTLLNAAVKWQLIFSNPCTRIEAPKAKPRKIPILNLEQTSTFLASLDGEPVKYKLLAVLALTTGLRRGELMALQWSNFDLKAKTLEVKKSFVYLPGPDKGLILKDPKTEESQRTIAIPDTVIELLSQHKANQNVKRLKLGDKWQSGIAEKWKEHNFVFTTWNGGPMHLDSFGIWLDKYLAKIDLPHISPHSFRHMAATFSLAAGKSLKSVSARLGHSRTSTTSDIYAHALKTVDREIADQMNDLVEAAKNKQTEMQTPQNA
jgi:integrase